MVEAIAAVVAQARALGAEVVLTTIFPLARGPWADPATQAAIATVNGRLGALAGDGVQVLDTPRSSAGRMATCSTATPTTSCTSAQRGTRP